MTLVYNRTTNKEYNKIHEKEYSIDIMLMVFEEEKYMLNYEVETIIKRKS